MGNVDVLVALEEMEAARWVDWLAPTGRMVVRNADPPRKCHCISGEVVDALKQRVSACLHIPADRLLEAAGSEKYVNVFLLGAASKGIDFPESAWYAAIERLVPPGTADANKAAFIAGRNLS